MMAEIRAEERAEEIAESEAGYKAALKAGEITFREKTPTLRSLRKKAREQGYTDAEFDRIDKESKAEVDAMTELEVSAEVLQYAVNTVRKDPDAINDRQVQSAIYTHVRNLCAMM